MHIECFQVPSGQFEVHTSPRYFFFEGQSHSQGAAIGNKGKKE